MVKIIGQKTFLEPTDPIFDEYEALTPEAKAAIASLPAVARLALWTYNPEGSFDLFQETIIRRDVPGARHYALQASAEATNRMGTSPAEAEIKILTYLSLADEELEIAREVEK